jgi:hypothetical protein
MLAALLRGKLSREQENLEDLITSCVFGALRYMPIEHGLAKLLQFAAFEDGSPLLRSAGQLQCAKFSFWPWLLETECVGAEPDILIELVDSRGKKFLLLVEAKLWSDKSSSPDEGPKPNDQLAKEWDNLVALCQRSDAQPMMLYVTADTRVPIDAFSESRNEFASKRPQLARTLPFSCAWLSWRHVARAFSRADGLIEADLVALVYRLGLTFFGGFTAITPPSDTWSFRSKFRLGRAPTDRTRLWEFAKR